MAKAIFRSDSCSFTHDGALIRSAVISAETQNCTPVVLGALASATDVNGKEVFSVSNASDGADVWVVANPEVSYLPPYALSEYTNEAGKVVKVVKPVKYDILSMSVEALSTAPTVGQYIHAGASKWTVNTASASAFAKCISTDTESGVTMYGFEVL